MLLFNSTFSKPSMSIFSCNLSFSFIASSYAMFKMPSDIQLKLTAAGIKSETNPRKKGYKYLRLSRSFGGQFLFS